MTHVCARAARTGKSLRSVPQKAHDFSHGMNGVCASLGVGSRRLFEDCGDEFLASEVLLIVSIYLSYAKPLHYCDIDRVIEVEAVGSHEACSHYEVVDVEGFDAQGGVGEYLLEARFDDSLPAHGFEDPGDLAEDECGG